MEWDDKVELCKKFNTDAPDTKEFIEKHLDSLDAQACDMLITGLEITQDTVLADKEFYQKVYDKCKPFDSSFSFRTGLRLELITVIIEDNGKTKD